MQAVLKQFPPEWMQLGSLLADATSPQWAQSSAIVMVVCTRTARDVDLCALNWQTAWNLTFKWATLLTLIAS
eukprot:6452402-Karenia_brevis.AAC.1